MHLIGVGDFNMTELNVMPDPCPIPDKDAKISRSLNKKDSLLYAPLSNVGAVSFDKDAVYIDIGRANYTKKENLAIGDKEDGAVSSSDSESDDEDDNAPASLLKNLQDIEAGVDVKMKNSSLRLFKSSKAVDVEENSDSESDDDKPDANDQGRRKMTRAEIEELAMPFRKRAAEDDEESGSDSDSSDDEGSSNDEEESGSDDEEDSDSDEDLESDVDDESGDETQVQSEPTSALWKTNLAQRAAEAYIGRELSHVNLQELIYGKSKSVFVSDDEEDDNKGDQDNDDQNDSDSDDEFFKIRKPDASSGGTSSAVNGKKSDVQLLGEEDSSRLVNGAHNDFDVSVWLEEGADCLIESIRDSFVTGNWGSSNAGGGDVDDEAFDDFEDLETGEKFGPNGEIDSGEDTDEEHLTDEQMRERNAQKKANKKTDFDAEYDDDKKLAGQTADPNDETAENEYIDSLKREKEARLNRNKAEFGEEGEASRIRHEGFRQGLYCRIRIDGVPCEFVDTFNPVLPLVLGGLTPQETNRGFIRCRFKKHRWHKKILKCNDPLIFSVGWRRFQSIPVFSTEDQNGRHR